MGDGGGAVPIGVALVGAGYWGSRLARNLAAAPACVVRSVCDVDPVRARGVAAEVGARATTSVEAVLGDPSVAAVVLATPATTHGSLATACLDADRHLLAAKPLALSVAETEGLAATARARSLVVTCDHTYRFAPVVGVIRALLADGALGPLVSVDSVRTNLRHGQPDVDVLVDLAHHDVSILTHVLPGHARPVAVRASTADVVGLGRPHAGSLALCLAGGADTSSRVDWWADAKVRSMRFTGVDATLEWDDLAPAGPRLELRTEDTVRPVPVADRREPLALVVQEFLAAIAQGRPSTCGPADEIEVLHVLDAAARSAAADGVLAPLDPDSGAPLRGAPRVHPEPRP